MGVKRVTTPEPRINRPPIRSTPPRAFLLPAVQRGILRQTAQHRAQGATARGSDAIGGLDQRRIGGFRACELGEPEHGRVVVSPSSNVVIWLRRADRVGRAPLPSSTQEWTMEIGKI